MISFKTYLWATSILASLLLCSSGFQLWLYLSDVKSEMGWMVLVQVANAVVFAATIPLTYRRNRRSMENAKADLIPPPWRPPSRQLDW